MGLIVDGLIGPILESLGIIEIGEDGEWKKREREARARKESHWFDGIKAWLSALFRCIKGLWTRKERKKRTTDIMSPSEAPNKPRTDRYIKKTLKKISKYEGKVLLSTGEYKVWYGDSMPKESEIEENAVYIVKGKGDQISHVPVLSGIRYDGYYIWDKEKYIEELNKEIEEELNELQQDQIKKVTISTVKECIEKSDHLMNEEHMKLREEARDRWKHSGIVVTDPERVLTITPDLM